MKKGSKMTEEQRRKNREAQKIVWANPKLRKRHSQIHKGQVPWNKGRKGVYSEEIRRKMGAKNIGRPSPMKGKSLSEETKKKLSRSIKKALSNPEWRQNRSKMVRNLWQNPEYREHMSKAAKSSVNEGRFITGHKHSKKIKNKLTEATLKQYERGDFPKQTNTKPERQLKEELIKRGYREGIDFIHQFKFRNKFMCDFCFPLQKIIVEVDGDFWHANPKKYSNQNKLHPHQIKGVGRDKSKNAYITKVDNGSWNLLRFWESDIKKDVGKCVDEVEKKLKKKIKTNAPNLK